MSRVLIFLILGILLVLLGVMGFVVNPKPQGPPTAEQIAQQRQQAQKAQDDEMKSRQEQMKKMIEINKKRQAELKKIEKNTGKSGVEAPMAHSVPAPVPTMDISSEWFKQHPDGVQGLAKLEAISKEQAAKDKKDAAERQKMMGGITGPGTGSMRSSQTMVP